MNLTIALSIGIPIIANIVAFVLYDISNKKMFEATVELHINQIKKEVDEIEDDIKEIKKDFVPRVELNSEFKNIYKRIELFDKKYDDVTRKL